MKVALVMGSISDKEVVEKSQKVLDDFGVEYETRVISAHRTPEVAFDFAKNAKKNGIETIITFAGKAAHLGGVIAGLSTLPVIGVPVKSSLMDGLDSLLSIVQMPKGVPVATVAVNGAENAAILAVQILAIKYDELAKKLEEYKVQMRDDIVKIDAELNK